MPIDADLERSVRDLLARGDVRGAMEALERGYGAEVHAFLRAFLASDADDAYQLWCEDVWLGLENFRGLASLRTWCFKVARNRAFTMQRGEGRRRKRFVELGSDEADGIPWQQRTTTAAFLSTSIKDEVRAIAREVLKEEDQEIFALHTGLRCSDVDVPLETDMTFDEIAMFLAADDEKLDEAEVKRRATAYRQRFKRAKDSLTKALEARGLRPPS